MKMPRMPRALRYVVQTAAVAALVAAAASPARAQTTGVDDDRVTLPDGAGSMGGVGDDVQIDPNMGSMSWNVPLELPSGHLTPNFGLSYSSAAGNGPVGIGWSIPFHTIERMTSRGTPHYTADDLFVVDGGTELVQVDDSDPNARVYRARFEKSFVRYVWHDAPQGKGGWWEAQAPDGSRSYFGADADGQMVDSARSTKPNGDVARYHMVAEVDTWGHKLVYDYDNFDGNQPVPVAISYAFVNGDPLYKVEIGWEERPDDINDATRGYEETLKYRVSDIKVWADSELVREYVLNYQPADEVGAISRLASVDHYGVGGKQSGALYPIRYSFDYSKALGGECTSEACGKPYLVDLGALTGAGGFGSGQSTFVDINADGLPDLLDTSDDGAHRFLINQMTYDENSGQFTQSFAAPTNSALSEATGANFRLGTRTDVLDVNGDGLSDLIDMNGGDALINAAGTGDWGSYEQVADTSSLSGVNLDDAQFLDINHDAKIDILDSDSTQTTLYLNEGDRFEQVPVNQVTQLGVSFGPTVELSDLNGDGLSDVARFQTSGQLDYRVNYGDGTFSDWRPASGLSLSPTQRPLADLKDLNGDGLDDVVIVTSDEITYALNTNGHSFAAPKTLTAQKLGVSSLPARNSDTTVLYADINGNGSDDIVWVQADGHMDYLELFPVRPNLLSRIDNGIGFVQKVTYESAAQQMARAAAAGTPWDKVLSMATQLVAKTESWVTLTYDEDTGEGIKETKTYSYRDGFYDGLEKQYRGFADVTVSLESAEGQEGGKTETTFDTGRQEPWRAGLTLEQDIFSGGDPINSSTMTYEDCPLAGIDNAALVAAGRHAVDFPCMTAQETTIKERRPQSEWKTTRTENTYDGYGNITMVHNLGVVDADGDESWDKTEYIDPTAEHWFVGLSKMHQHWEREGGDVRTETRTYYDGDAFVGSDSDVTHGFVSRKTVKVDDNKVINTYRARPDADGNAVETIDADGSPDDQDAHRREYTYDDSGLFVTGTDLKVGSGVVLRRESNYDRKFQKPTLVSEWMLVLDGQVKSNRDATQIRYDDFGRIIERSQPGDVDGKPSTTYEWKLGNSTDTPFTAIVIRTRSQAGGELDGEAVECRDGRGRAYQKRYKLQDGTYQVTGFTSYNKNGAVVASYQPWVDAKATCSLAPPDDVLATRYTYDATGRRLELSKPGEAIYGERLKAKTEYRPLEVLAYDAEDLHADGPFADTPQITYSDGLGRAVRLERKGAGGATYQLHYDETGSFSGYTDPSGAQHTQVVDLAGRTVQVDDPNTGAIELGWDDADNVIWKKDARGKTVKYAYDGINRLIEQWDDDNRDATLATLHYDTLPDGCDKTECTNLAGKLAAINYPLAGGFGHGMDRFGYDVRRRAVLSARTFGEQADFVTHFEYDNVNHLTRLTYPDGTEITPEYGLDGRILDIPGYVKSAAYTPRAAVDSLEYANGTKIDISLDELMRLKAQMQMDASGKVFSGLTYERDRMGNITKVDDLAELANGVPSSGRTLSYDAWYRLTEAKTQADGDMPETVGFQFDKLDRTLAISSSLPSGGRASMPQLTYDDSAPQRLKSAGDTAFSYDAAGALIGRGDLQIERDYLLRPVRFGRGGRSEEQLFGAGSQRIGRIGHDNVLLYGDNFELRDGVAISYVRLGNRVVARHQSLEMGLQVYGDPDGDGELTAADAFAMRDNDTGLQTPARLLGAVAARMLAADSDAKTFLYSDEQGNIIAATDEAGKVRGQRGFYPTGQTRFEHGFVDFYGYTGREYNDFSGFIEFPNRDLDPQTGRWTSFDPMFAVTDVEKMARFGEATTGYAFVAGNFANSTDPSGLKGRKKKGHGLFHRIKAKFGGGGNNNNHERDRSNSAEEDVRQPGMDLSHLGINASTGSMNAGISGSTRERSGGVAKESVNNNSGDGNELVYGHESDKSGSIELKADHDTLGGYGTPGGLTEKQQTEAAKAALVDEMIINEFKATSAIGYVFDNTKPAKVEQGTGDLFAKERKQETELEAAGDLAGGRDRQNSMSDEEMANIMQAVMDASAYTGASVPANRVRVFSVH